MEIKNALSFVIFMYAILLTCAVEEEVENGYIFLAPRSLKMGSNNELQFIRFGSPKEGMIKVKLFYSESYNGNETLAQEKEYKLEDDKKETLLDFYMNPIDIDHVYNGRLQINGTLGDKPFSGSVKVYFSSPKKYICIIQTDKPLYKPGQEVKFRVLKLDKDFRPSTDEKDVADVYVEDPKGTRLYEFNGVKLSEGVKQMQFPLADEPVLGNWKITVTTKNDTESTTFDVKEYVLPKFDLKIKFPSYVLANAESIPIEVCAKYTYGKNVVGTLNLNVSLETYSYSRDKIPVLEESVKLDGCFNYTINVSKIEPGSSYRYRRIMTVANVIEEGTGVQRNETQYLQRQYSPLYLDFNTDQNHRQYYKPGLPYTGRLRVTNPDESPAEGECIEICATVSKHRVIANWDANKKIKYCSNYTSDAKGYIKYALEPQNTDTTSIQLDARSLKYARDSRRSEPNSLSQPTTSMSLSPFYSPSGSFIQLETVGKPIPCGTQKNIRVLFTADRVTGLEQKFHYEILRQGEVVKFDTVDVSFDSEDDVSSKYTNNDELINDSETQLLPPPQSESDDSSSSEENCPGAKEARYVPPIGEVNIPVDVDASVSPSLTLIVYYVREDRETVADSQRIEVEKCFKNEVDFEFGNEEKQPGTKTSIRVTSSPNSLCGLKVVDKSVSLLDSNDQLTKDKIFRLKENMDSGIYYSINPCNEDVPQPGLYSTKASSIIRPPHPWSTSPYEDSYGTFQEAGFLVISNLILFTRPCFNNGGYGSGPIYQSESFIGGAGGPAVALASTARRPAAPVAMDADNKMGIASTKSAVEIRDYFPETWLFEMQATGPDGVYATKETLPHTITEWVGSAFCINEEDGFGLSNTTSIKGFQAFFISYTLPINVIRGEEFVLIVSVFSYADAYLPISVSLDQMEGLSVTSDAIDGDICVQPGTSKTLPIRLKGTSVGSVNITVRAETASSSSVCGDSPVSDSLAKDAITQSLEVLPEGFPREEVHSILFCPTDEENQMFTDSYSLALPEDVVPDSSRAIIDVTGNVMGPAIQNLNNLVTLPTGCGEQNMVKFTPNYLVLDYLKDIGKLTDSIKNKAIRNLNTGYQRELNYRHNDGSFSAFGETDKEGSMFLTAFVLRSFYTAQKYIAIDDNVIRSMQKWICDRQQTDGCFPNVGKIIDRGLQVMAAYVLESSFLDSKAIAS
ncbi:murinoglobulin-1 [Nephila pilipes]|uniref:TEP1-F n=1 Tax=Nephila pilipes TaxID=299642 RepID=A0A8X6MG20_NEPPI|nr:murinoglobulin-1 [Nephila pilipes]